MLCVEPGDKLALARKYALPALTQEELAKALGVDTSSVGRWESKNAIPKDKLPRLSEILMVEPNWFFDGRSDPPSHAQRYPLPERANVSFVREGVGKLA